MEKLFLLPDLGEGLAEAIIREWYVKEGDIVTMDQSLAAMETDKALVEIPSPYQGKILKLYGDIDQPVKTDMPFILFEIAEQKGVSNDSDTVVGSLSKTEKITELSDALEPTNIKKRLTPKAWAIVQKHALKDDFLQQHFSQFSVITESDLQPKLKAFSTPALKQAKAPIMKGFDSIRQAMFKRISQAHKDSVPVSLFDDANISHWPNKSDFTVKVIKAIEAAVKAVPVINSHFLEGSHALETLEHVHCGIAMDSEHGLFVPVLHHIESLEPSAIRSKINDFKSAVKQKKLRKEDTLNPTILLSNFGMFGAKYATPMVVPPMVCIVGLGQSHKKPVVINDDQIAIATVLPISITVDHRVITGGEATRFLAALIEHLEND
jgi:pyruvate dehydrogenase E2 component (dihydrolipoamide acetyltransferase)